MLTLVMPLYELPFPMTMYETVLHQRWKKQLTMMRSVPYYVHAPFHSCSKYILLHLTDPRLQKFLWLLWPCLSYVDNLIERVGMSQQKKVHILHCTFSLSQVRKFVLFE